MVMKLEYRVRSARIVIRSSPSQGLQRGWRKGETLSGPRQQLWQAFKVNQTLTEHSFAFAAKDSS